MGVVGQTDLCDVYLGFGSSIGDFDCFHFGLWGWVYGYMDILSIYFFGVIHLSFI